MRSMRYRLELEDGDEGYLIYNAETDWNGMPKLENLQRPSIRVKNVPFCGKVVADIASCVSIGDFYEVEPEFDGTPERFLHDTFKANHVRILHGELPEWVLSVVRIDRGGVTMAFFYRETGQEETVYVNWTNRLEMLFEVDRADSSGVDTYLVKLSAEGPDYEDRRYLKVTEQDAYGKREIVFTQWIGAEKAHPPGDGWVYAYVTEYR